MKVRFSRWPWQGGKEQRIAPLNPRGSRFGGGWDYKLGISISRRTILLELIWGMIVISWYLNDRG